MSCSLNDLPNEVIQEILLHVPPICIPAFQQVSSKFNRLAGSLVWRHHCQTQFKYWSPQHRMREKFSANVEEVDWKSIFAERYRIDCATSHAVDSILSSQVGRIEKAQLIVKYGYDAKDCLLRNLRSTQRTEDILARHYYSDAILGCLHRTLAVEEWSRLKEMQDVSLEKALAAFDMFVLETREGDFDEISHRLDKIAADMLSHSPDFEEQNPRQKAIFIAKYLRSRNLTGISQTFRYHELQNNFLGIALHDENHPSLPLISTAIYCSVARRCGLDARACGFPFHVLAIIIPAAGFDMNGFPMTAGEASSPMYLDAFTYDQETSIEDLLDRLRAVGALPVGYKALLDASPTSELILRTARNILTSVQYSHRADHARNDMGRDGDLQPPRSFPDLESAFYGALWASLLLGIPADRDGPVIATVRRGHYLPHIVEQFETHFPTDISLIERFIVPLFPNLDDSAQLRESVRIVRVVDSMAKQVKSRTNEISRHVRYYIGEVFQHKRYGYKAVIIGWDMECGADEHWMAQMRIHELSHGRHQSFYHALVQDKSVRYVAEENIIVQVSVLPPTLVPLAGRYFKRWDDRLHRFVSNIRDEYPDD